MSTPTTKVAIANRLNELNDLLKSKRGSASGQIDERQELMESCRLHGDHVPGMAVIGDDVGIACQFCGHQPQATLQQISRNVNRGPY